MSEPTRQQRRARQRDLAKLGRTAMTAGLGLSPSREALLGVAIVFKAKLRERGNDRRGSDAAGMAQALAETTLARAPGSEPLACKKGCHYCCTAYVGVTAPEVFLVADAVRRARPMIGLSPRQRFGAKLSCALLVDGICAVYAARPLVCRQAASLSLPACIGEYEGTDGVMSVPRRPMAASSNAHVAFLGAMRAAGLRIDGHELSGALDVALAMPDAQARWLAGEDVFAALPRTFQRESEVTTVIERIAAEIGD